MATPSVGRSSGLVESVAVDREDVALGDPADDGVVAAVHDWEAVLVGVPEGLDRVVERVVGVDERRYVGEVAGVDRRRPVVLNRAFEVSCGDHAE